MKLIFDKCSANVETKAVLFSQDTEFNNDLLNYAKHKELNRKTVYKKLFFLNFAMSLALLGMSLITQALNDFTGLLKFVGLLAICLAINFAIMAYIKIKMFNIDYARIYCGYWLFTLTQKDTVLIDLADINLIEGKRPIDLDTQQLALYLFLVVNRILILEYTLSPENQDPMIEADNPQAIIDILSKNEIQFTKSGTRRLVKMLNAKIED